MPLPTTTYDTATVLNPSGALTDFTLMVDLSRMSAAWWAAAEDTNARRGRAAKDDETELACDWIDYDHAGQTGWLRVKWSGTLASSGTQVLRIYPPVAANSIYTSGSTYGRDNAYDAYFLGYWPDAVTDRISGSDGAMTGGMTAGGTVGPAGPATFFDGIDDYVQTDLTPTIVDQVTMSAWVKHVEGGWEGVFDDASGAAISRFGISTVGKSFVRANNVLVYGSTTIPIDEWHHIAASVGPGGHQMYIDGSPDGYSASTIAGYTTTNPIRIGYFDGSNVYKGEIQHALYEDTARSGAWIEQEFDQTNDQAAFWGTWTNNPLGSSAPDLTAEYDSSPLADGATVDLGNIVRSDTAQNITITITNDGDAEATSIVVTDGGDLFDTDTGTLGSTLAVDASGTVILDLDISTPGAVSGTVSIASDDPDSPLNITFGGTVVAPSLSAEYDSSPLADGGSIDLGSLIERNDTPDIITVTYTNDGDGIATGIDISTTGVLSDTGTGTLGSTLAAGASGTVVYAVDRSAVGTLSGTASVASSDTDSPHAISVEGTVIWPPSVRKMRYLLTLPGDLTNGQTYWEDAVEANGLDIHTEMVRQCNGYTSSLYPDDLTGVLDADIIEAQRYHVSVRLDDWYEAKPPVLQYVDYEPEGKAETWLRYKQLEGYDLDDERVCGLLLDGTLIASPGIDISMYRTPCIFGVVDATKRTYLRSAENIVDEFQWVWLHCYLASALIPNASNLDDLEDYIRSHHTELQYFGKRVVPGMFFNDLWTPTEALLYGRRVMAVLTDLGYEEVLIWADTREDAAAGQQAGYEAMVAEFFTLRAIITTALTPAHQASEVAPDATLSITFDRAGIVFQDTPDTIEIVDLDDDDAVLIDIATDLDLIPEEGDFEWEHTTVGGVSVWTYTGTLDLPAGANVGVRVSGGTFEDADGAPFTGMGAGDWEFGIGTADLSVEYDSSPIADGASIALGSVDQDDSVQVVLSVTNDGIAAATGIEASATGDASVTGGTLGATLDPDASGTVIITLDTSALGATSAGAVIASSDPLSPYNITINFTVEDIMPAPVVINSSPADGDTDASGELSAIVLLWIESVARSTGNFLIYREGVLWKTVAASATTIDSFNTNQQTIPLDEAPGLGVDLYVLAQASVVVGSASTLPNAAITDPTFLNFTTLSNGPAELSVTELATSGGTIAMGNIAKGATVNQTVTINNSATEPAEDLEIGTVTVTGDFTLVSSFSDETVVPGDSLEGFVRMDTSAEGAVAALMTIPSNDPATPFVVNITATVVGARLTLSAGAGSIDDGESVAVGSAIEDAELTWTASVQNTGLTSLVIGTPVATGDASIDSENNPGGQTLAPGETASIVMVFDTATAGAVEATLSIPSNDPASPLDITLTGTVTDSTATTARHLYLTVSECTAILAELLPSTDLLLRAWNAMSGDDKIIAVANASVDFDSVRWDGRVAVAGQRTLWPRVDDFGDTLMASGELGIPASLGTEEWSFPGLPAEIRLGVAMQAAARAAATLRVDTDLDTLARAAAGIEGISGAGASFAANPIIARMPRSRLHRSVLQLVAAYLPSSVEVV